MYKSFCNITKNPTGLQAKISVGGEEYQPHIKGHSTESLKGILLERNALWIEHGTGPKGYLLKKLAVDGESSSSNTGYNGVYDGVKRERSGKEISVYQVNVRDLYLGRPTMRVFRKHLFNSEHDALECAIAYKKRNAEAYNDLVERYNAAKLIDLAKLADYEAEFLRPKIYLLRHFDWQLWNLLAIGRYESLPDWTDPEYSWDTFKRERMASNRRNWMLHPTPCD